MIVLYTAPRLTRLTTNCEEEDEEDVDVVGRLVDLVGVGQLQSAIDLCEISH
jgi:hypothetical protein